MQRSEDKTRFLYIALLAPLRENQTVTLPENSMDGKVLYSNRLCSKENPLEYISTKTRTVNHRISEKKAEQPAEFIKNSKPVDYE